jgi:hypothetical protein
VYCRGARSGLAAAHPDPLDCLSLPRVDRTAKVTTTDSKRQDLSVTDPENREEAILEAMAR